MPQPEWDRGPESDDPAAEWPSRDLDRGDEADPAAPTRGWDDWSMSDRPPDRPAPSSSRWDDPWPPPPVDTEYGYGVEPMSSDLWSERWDEGTATSPAEPAPGEPAQAWSPEPEAPESESQPWSAPQPAEAEQSTEPMAPEAQPWAEPTAAEPEPTTEPMAPEPQPWAEPIAADAQTWAEPIAADAQPWAEPMAREPEPWTQPSPPSEPEPGDWTEAPRAEAWPTAEAEQQGPWSVPEPDAQTESQPYAAFEPGAPVGSDLDVYVEPYRATEPSTVAWRDMDADPLLDLAQPLPGAEAAQPPVGVDQEGEAPEGESGQGDTRWWLPAWLRESAPEEAVVSAEPIEADEPVVAEAATTEPAMAPGLEPAEAAEPSAEEHVAAEEPVGVGEVEPTADVSPPAAEQAADTAPSEPWWRATSWFKPRRADESAPAASVTAAAVPTEDVPTVEAPASEVQPPELPVSGVDAPELQAGEAVPQEWPAADLPAADAALEIAPATVGAPDGVDVPTLEDAAEAWPTVVEPAAELELPTQAEEPEPATQTDEPEQSWAAVELEPAPPEVEPARYVTAEWEPDLEPGAEQDAMAVAPEREPEAVPALLEATDTPEAVSAAEEATDVPLPEAFAEEAEPGAIAPEPEPMVAAAAEPEPMVAAAAEPEPTDEAAAEPVAEPAPAAAAAAPLPLLRYDEDAPIEDTTQWETPPWLHESGGDGQASARAAASTAAELQPETGAVATSLAEPWPGALPEAGTAEHAVPWLIGIILLLGGMVIVLMALIFSGDESLGLVVPGPSGSGLPSAADLASGSPEVSDRTEATAPAVTPAPTAVPSPTLAPITEFGPLDMVYLGRSAALAPIYLLRHDFTTADEPIVLAQDPNLDVRSFHWAVDGSHGAALLVDVLVSIEPGIEKRRLADTVSAITFGDEPTTVYAVRTSRSAGIDTATVLAIDYASGEQLEIASVTYPAPDVGPEAPIQEAQFIDDGGSIRLYWMADDMLRLWVLGANTWQVNPASGEVTELGVDAVPLLWSPDGSQRVAVTESGTTSTLVLYESDGAEVARTAVEGLISHLRWSPDGERVVFTLGRSGAAGGVRQDLFLWDLAADVAPMQVTNSGAAFAPEWLGENGLWQ